MNVKSFMHLFNEFVGLYSRKAIYKRQHPNNFDFLPSEKPIV